ncbi:hypothetical protein TNCT_157481 [Trichonephila clavata]|uniref:Uncharacterized protein n=1 Tax=Trichonephila clavata TaxID=2740835 RepID=A0A8X6GMC9_TRICU|nr:hypothetical protein TNCT_157481 [Trichonephila clavata]
MGEKREKRTQGALRSTPGTGKELFRRGTSGAVPARRPLFPIRNGSPDRAEKPRFPVPENKKKTPSPLLISEPLAGSSRKSRFRSVSARRARIRNRNSEIPSTFGSPASRRRPRAPFPRGPPLRAGLRKSPGKRAASSSTRDEFLVRPGTPVRDLGARERFRDPPRSGPGFGARIPNLVFSGSSRRDLPGLRRLELVTRSVRVLRAEEVFRNVAKISKSRVRNATFSNNSRKKGSNFVNLVSYDRQGRHASTEVPFVEKN